MRKDPTLPRFVAFAASTIDAWQLAATTVVEARINGVELGRRSLKQWGPGRDCWFLDLTESQCKKADVETGSSVVVDLQRADETLPKELAILVGSDPLARSAWESRSPSSQRQLSEHVRAGKRAETRVRRARSALAPCK